jgi:hypothetical protein
MQSPKGAQTMIDRIPAATLSDIAEMAQKYLWWKAIGAEGHSTGRMIAQIMRLGTYDDIRSLESMLRPELLGSVMAASAPGWFDDRSWDFWRGRLSASGVADLPEQRPRRTFSHADLL